jgi:hypothetical protein
VAVRVLGTVGAFLIVSGLFAGMLIQYFPIDRPKPYEKRVNMATGNCLRTTVLLALDKYPAQTIFTFVDMGPRLITITHHDAIAGPYHRNGDAILDVQHAFGGTADQAHAIIKRHGATMLLLCPNAAESTNYKARSPKGFYAQMAKNEVPAWLTPLPLPAKSPLRLFKVD